MLKIKLVKYVYKLLKIKDLLYNMLKIKHMKYVYKLF